MDDWKVLYSGTTQEKLNFLSRQVQQLQAENAKLKATLKHWIPAGHPSAAALEEGEQETD